MSSKKEDEPESRTGQVKVKEEAIDEENGGNGKKAQKKEQPDSPRAHDKVKKEEFEEKNGSVKRTVKTEEPPTSPVRRPAHIKAKQEESDDEKNGKAKRALKKEEPATSPGRRRMTARDDEDPEDEEKDWKSDSDAEYESEGSDVDSESHRKKYPAGEVWVNRAAVLHLWVAVVAEREGYSFDEGLTYGRAIASLFARAKLMRFGRNPPPLVFGGAMGRRNAERRREHGEKIEEVYIMGRRIYTKRMADGKMYAVDPRGNVIDPQRVLNYLRSKFGDHLETVKDAMETLARSYSKEEIDKVAYCLYEQFRPEVPDDERGLGAQGRLDVKRILDLA